MSDPLHITRASSALYDTLCPGRHLAQKGLTEFEPDEDALKGTRIHALYAGKEVQDADEDEIEAAQEARVLEMSAFSEWQDRLPGYHEKTVYSFTEFREEAMIIMGDDGQPYHRGQPDLMVIAVSNHAPVTAHVFINDLKALWGLHDRSDQNLQLRDYAALVSMTYTFAPVESVTVNLMQPNKSKKPDLVTYDSTALMIAQSEMLDRIAVSRTEGSPRVPGARQCKYCLAKMQCPEYLQTVKDLAAQVIDKPDLKKEDILKSLSLVDNAKLLKLLDQHELLKQAHDAIRMEAKRRLALDPMVLPGWRYRQIRPRRKVSDVGTVYQRLVNFGVPPKEFTDECTINLSSIADLIRRHSKIDGKTISGKTLDEAVEDAVKDAVTLNKPAYTLERIEG